MSSTSITTKANRLACGLLASTFMAPLAATVSPAQAQSPETFSFKTQCTTEGTNRDGSGNDCNAERQCFNAPAGHVINKDAVNARFLSAAGRNNNCNVGFDNFVEIIPGSNIKMPRTICMHAHALSPGGIPRGGERGWTHCEVTGEYVKIDR